jgi:hypothetical protein
MAALNLAGFKKMKEDKKTVTMSHPMGHKITILKSKIPAIQREQLKRLPIHAAKGDADVGNEDEQSSMEQIPTPMPAPTPPIGAPSAATQEAQETSDQDNTSVPDVNNVPVAEDRFTTGQGGATGSWAPESGTPADVPQVNPLDKINAGDIYSKESGAIGNKAQAESDLATQQANAYHQYGIDLKTANDNWNKSSQAMLGDVSGALQDYKNGHINPSHYLDDRGPGGLGGTGQRIATAIGLLVGGFTGGFNKTGVNPAMDWLNGQIGRDIDAQKVNQENKLNVYNGYLAKYKNAQAAEEMTRATRLGMLSNDVNEATTKAGTPLAIANGKIAQAQLEQQILPLVQHAHLLSQLSPFTGTGGQGAPSGSEAQFHVGLNSAQTIDPEVYKDLQSKYVPSIGVASHPVADVDRERLTNLNSIIPLIDKAQEDTKRFGSLGAWSYKNQADATSDKEALTAQLGKLRGAATPGGTGNNIYDNYLAQVGNIGSHDFFGGGAELLNRLKSQAITDRDVGIQSAGIKPFSDARLPKYSEPQKYTPGQQVTNKNTGQIGVVDANGKIRPLNGR